MNPKSLSKKIVLNDGREIIIETGSLLWLKSIYNVDLSTNTYETGFDTDLHEIANNIYSNHDRQSTLAEYWAHTFSFKTIDVKADSVYLQTFSKDFQLISMESMESMDFCRFPWNPWNPWMPMHFY